MIELSKGTYGAKVHSFSNISPRAEIMRRMESGVYTLDDEGRDQCEKDMFVEFAGAGEFWASVWSYYHANNWNACLRDIKQRKSVPSLVNAAKERELKISKEMVCRSNQIKEKIKDYLTISMSTLMPNGKPLSDCTRADLMEIGGFYGRVINVLITRMDDKQKVSDVWSDKEIDSF